MSFVSTKTNTNLPIGSSSSRYEARAQAMCLALILFIFAAIYLLPRALNVNGTIGSFLFDDGIRLAGAEQVLQGQIPYRDFYAIYGPAQFYWLALLLKIFGVQYLTLRANVLFFTALGAVAIFTFCRKIAVSLPSSLLAYFGFLLPRAYIDPALALLFLAGITLLKKPSWGNRFSAGLMLGIAALFRHDLGLYGTVAALAACFAGQTMVVGRWWLSLKRVAAEEAWLLLGILVTAGVGYGALALTDWHALIENLLIFPATATNYRRLPPFTGLAPMFFSNFLTWRPNLEGRFNILVYAGPLVILIMVLPIVFKTVRRELDPTWQLRAGLVFLILLVPGFAMYGFGVSEWFHLVPLYMVAMPLTAIQMHNYCKTISGHFYWRCIKKAVITIAASATLLVFVVSAKHYCWDAVPLRLERARAIVQYPRGESSGSIWLVNAVDDLHRETGPIFVAGDRHDRVYINAMGIYFLSGRQSGTYFAQFDPGITTTESAQRRIIADLEKNDVKTVFVWHIPDEPNLSGKSSGVRLLDGFLGDNYVEIKREKDYSILKRKT